jgi:hypothetical protein
MIHSIYIINRGGETLAVINRGTFDMDEDLFGGFLSAIQMYSQKVSGKNVRELSLEDYRLVISETVNLFLVTIHDSKDKDALSSNAKVRQVLDELTSDLVTDDMIEILEKAADDADGKAESATDWARKML